MDPDAIRARATVVINHLISMIDEGAPGHELDGVVPLASQLDTLCTQLGYQLPPMRFHVKERDGWSLRICDTCDPWGGSANHRLLSKFKLAGQPGDKVREHLESLDFPIVPDDKQDILRKLRAWRREFEHPLLTKETAELPTPAKAVHASDASGDLIRTLNKLTDRQRGILLALLESRAFGRDSRLRTEDVAKAAEGRAANPSGFKRPVADLSLLRIIDSLDGREGGIWLTQLGRDLAAHLRPGQDGQSGAA